MIGEGDLTCVKNEVCVGEGGMVNDIVSYFGKALGETYLGEVS